MGWPGMRGYELESMFVMQRSREEALMFALFSSFETSRRAAVIATLSLTFNHSITNKPTNF
jgi:hypothetical protein